MTACSNTVEEQEEKIGEVNVLYNEGADLMERGEFTDALHTFQELERQHPYSGWATRAQIMSIFANYRLDNFQEALIGIERFIRHHPGHEDLDYIYYLKGLAFYNRISDVKRDQGYTDEALLAFRELEERYPDSVYAQDARLKITLCEDHLAGQEMMVGRFYQTQGRYLAGINRFREVLKNYEKSTHTPEALFRLTESYLALGVKDEAKRTAAILGHNFPDTSWYKDAYRLIEAKNLVPAGGTEKSWLGQVVKGVKGVF